MKKDASFKKQREIYQYITMRNKISFNVSVAKAQLKSAPRANDANLKGISQNFPIFYISIRFGYSIDKSIVISTYYVPPGLEVYFTKRILTYLWHLE